MNPVRFETKNAKNTERAAELFAREATRDGVRKGALVVALSGDLGGGKTTFARGFARGLGIRDAVTSPTFLIARIYPIQHKAFRRLVHVDAYRLASADEMKTIGWRDWVRDPRTVILVEWARNIERLLPKNHFDIHFEFVSETKRAITIHAEGR